MAEINVEAPFATGGRVNVYAGDHPAGTPVARVRAGNGSVRAVVPLEPGTPVTVAGPAGDGTTFAVRAFVSRPAENPDLAARLLRHQP